MATIDYKEKYEQAFEVAQRFYNNSVAITKKGLEDIFPELAGSEDDRIRKRIIDLIKEVVEDDSYHVYRFDEMIAWLEKQGGQKPNFCHHEVDLSDCSEEYRKAYYDGWNNCNIQHSLCKSELEDVAKCLINGMKFYYEDDEEATWGTDKWSMPVKHIIEVLEKQCEHKPYGQREECSDCQYNYAGECKGYCVMKRGEQKPTTLSEEDKRIIDNLISQLGNLYSRKLIKKSTKDKYANWLKSLKDRVQPKIEWSREDRAMLDCVTTILCEDGKYEENERQIEWLKKIKNKAFPELKNSWGQEDEEHIHSIISTIECCKKEYKHATAVVGQYNSDLDWLKSLRPQNRWKPSDEQIKVCKEVYADILSAKGFNIGTVNSELNRMEEKLKKLREEL